MNPTDTSTAGVDADAKEWEQAITDFSEGAGYKPAEVVEDKIETKEVVEDKKEPEVKSEVEPEIKTEVETKIEPETKPETKPVIENIDKVETKPETKPEPGAESEPESSVSKAVREQRSIQREIAKDREALMEDVHKEMFSDVPDKLVDADGDPIHTIEDVQKLKNPVTETNFTEEEAASWLLSAQQHLNKKLADMQNQKEAIVDTALSLKDQADNVKIKYGSLFKEMPDLSKEVWVEFEKTLVKHPDSGIILKSPVSLEGFYDVALAGYVKYTEQIKSQAGQTAELEKKVVKVQAHSDRQDIYTGGKTDTLDAEEKEWEQAAKALYEN
jgi:hypothetical protein